MIDLNPSRVTFFESPLECISQFEAMPWTKKAISFIRSIGTLLTYVWNKVLWSLQGLQSQISPYMQPPVEGFSKKKLIVCLHGLNDHPFQFKRILDEIQTQTEFLHAHVYIPSILQKGHAKLDIMAAPIFAEIQKWAEKEGEKELILVGISNGGRIARAIEVELAKSREIGNIKSLKFISIVGACQGSSLVNLAHRLHLSWLLSKNIAEEMPLHSPRNKQLNDDLMLNGNGFPFSRLSRNYIFIASPHDWQVPDYASTLMPLPSDDQTHRARYAIIPNHGHLSIVNAIPKTIAKIIFE